LFTKERTYYYLLGLLIVIFVVFQIFKPKPLDWTESFSADSKIPYGGYLLHEYLPSLFTDQELTQNQAPLFNYGDTLNPQKNWIFINKSFGLDQFETDILLSQIQQGAHVFIAARTFQNTFKDSLNIGTTLKNPLLGGGSILDDDTARVHFTNPALKTQAGYPYYQSTTQTYFSGIDSAKTVAVLGTNDEGETNFLRIKMGEGNLYLHSNPTLFTNYFVRDENGIGYVSKALSYLPDQPVIWDEYYKDVNRTGGSVVRYVVSEENLRRAWVLGIVGLLLFMIFRAKRKQRVIPEITPPQNSSIEFAKTIGDLYMEKGDHKLMAKKKIRFFFEYVRTNLGLDTDEETKQLTKDISNRSGIEHSEIEALFDIIELTSDKEDISAKELKLLTDRIDRFYNQSQR
tara:strand:+ start:16868 stop:18070 length:1203 start_codon:yes stop_codon:yes gene_type:complete